MPVSRFTQESFHPTRQLQLHLLDFLPPVIKKVLQKSSRREEKRKKKKEIPQDVDKQGTAA